MDHSYMYIFGGSNGRTWDERDWTASDDRVRGGKSLSRMTTVLRTSSAGVGTATTGSNAGGGQGQGQMREEEHADKGPADAETETITETETKTKMIAARFWGNLDITALGGAGFASQRTTVFEGGGGGGGCTGSSGSGSDAGSPLDLRGYDALVLNILVPSQNDNEDGNGGKNATATATTTTTAVKKYTVVLKDTILPRRPDGREQSTISWEADFVLDLDSKTVSAVTGEGSESTGGSESVIVTLPFADFKPTYRGKPVDNDGDVKLDWGGIKRFSIMVRSFFGEQHGPFNLVISSIAARKTTSVTV